MTDLYADFLLFHEANPHIYARLVGMTTRWQAAGHGRVGMKMLFEVLRWERGIQTNREAEDYKLNNNFTAFYARLISQQEPALAEMFELRAQRSQT